MKNLDIIFDNKYDDFFFFHFIIRLFRFTNFVYKNHTHGAYNVLRAYYNLNQHIFSYIQKHIIEEIHRYLIQIFTEFSVVTHTYRATHNI